MIKNSSCPTEAACSGSCGSCPRFSLLFSLSSQSLTLIGKHPLQPGLSLFFSFYGHSHTMSDAHPLQPGLSLFFSLGSQSITLIGAHPLQPGLCLFFSFYSHSLTMSDAHPLQPDLSLFFSLGCPSFPSLLLGCRSIFRSHRLSSTLQWPCLIFRFLNLSSLCSEALRALSLSLLWRSLLALICRFRSCRP